jgi:hypothetical protein
LPSSSPLSSRARDITLGGHRATPLATAAPRLAAPRRR